MGKLSTALVRLGKSPGKPATFVFINCPYDKEFEPLFDAIVLATACCGFQPRSASERADIAKTRIERITEAMFACRYSIHDLSRCRGAGEENLARFNMPLELGMAMARRFLRPEQHDWLVLIPAGPQFARYISDLSAFDPLIHDGERKSVIACVMRWLADRPTAIVPPAPARVWSALSIFEAKMEKLRAAWGGMPRWVDRVALAVEIANRLVG